MPSGVSVAGHGPNGAVSSLAWGSPFTNSVTDTTSTSSLTSTAISKSEPLSYSAPSVGLVMVATGDWVSGVEGPNSPRMCWYEFCVLPPQEHARSLYSPQG